MQNQRAWLAVALYRKLHRVSWPATDVGLVGSDVGVQGSAIDADNAVASPQPCAFRGASCCHIRDYLRMRFFVILRSVENVEAEFHPWHRVAHGVHPEGTIRDGNQGKQSCHACQKRFWEQRALTHELTKLTVSSAG